MIGNGRFGGALDLGVGRVFAVVWAIRSVLPKYDSAMMSGIAPLVCEVGGLVEVDRTRPLDP